MTEDASKIGLTAGEFSQHGDCTIAKYEPREQQVPLVYKLRPVRYVALEPKSILDPGPALLDLDGSAEAAHFDIVRTYIFSACQ